ncbi:EndoU domain-containing protein [Enterococcus mundtii]|uniref:EndoU domain-containing protein n=1 Tax=Enterococcus mundtii TaxID=53346 RepID=UPI0035C0C495
MKVKKKWFSLLMVVMLFSSVFQPTLLAFASDRSFKEATSRPAVAIDLSGTSPAKDEKTWNEWAKLRGFTNTLTAEHNVFDNLVLADYLDVMEGPSTLPLSTRFARSKIAPIIQATAFAEFTRPYLKESTKETAVSQLYRLTSTSILRQSISLLGDAIDAPEDPVEIYPTTKIELASWITVQNQFLEYIQTTPELSGYEMRTGTDGMSGLFVPKDTNDQSLLVYPDTSLNEYLPGNEKLPPRIGALKQINFSPYNGPETPYVNVTMSYTAYDHRQELYTQYDIRGITIPLETDFDTFLAEIATPEQALELVKEYSSVQFGAVVPTDVDSVNDIGKEITRQMIDERDALIDQLPDTFQTNLFRIAAKANDKEVVIDREGEFVYRGTQEIVPLDQIDIGFNQEIIYTIRKVQSFFGVYCNYYALADGLFDEERTNSLPKSLDDTTIAAISEVGGSVLKHLPNYENTDWVIKQSQLKLEPMDVLLIAMCLPWSEMISVLQAVESEEVILAAIEVEEAEAARVLEAEKALITKGCPNEALVERLPTTEYYNRKALRHVAGEVRPGRDGRLIISGAHSRHPDFYSPDSGVVYEPTGIVVEGKPFEAKVSYGTNFKGAKTTVFPDNWNAEKITSEVERIIEEKVTDVPGRQDLIGKETGGVFSINVSVNVKANGKVTVVTAYPVE